MRTRQKLAIIGASRLQNSLILKAKELGLETHVFAWKVGDIGEETADYFYPISIVEKEKIYDKCKEIGIDGICSVASDLAVDTVSFVATKLGLITNSRDCCQKSTNKFLMRKCFEENNDPSPKFMFFGDEDDLSRVEEMTFPLIVKPFDRSGSRGIYRCENVEQVEEAVIKAKEISFKKGAMIEEYAKGVEYSVECISFEGVHKLISVTLKYTTGAPHYIETGHLEPAPISKEIKNKIESVVYHALTSLDIEYGASHSEIKIDNNEIKIIEIGSRMGGDFIGSDLVPLSTGYDFLKEVIKISIGEKPSFPSELLNNYSAVRFIFGKEDFLRYKKIKESYPDLIIKEEVATVFNEEVTDSSTRNGYYIMCSNDASLIELAMQYDEKE